MTMIVNVLMSGQLSLLSGNICLNSFPGNKDRRIDIDKTSILTRKCEFYVWSMSLIIGAMSYHCWSECLYNLDCALNCFEATHKKKIIATINLHIPCTERVNIIIMLNEACYLLPLGHNHERNKWLQRCHCTEQRPRRQRTPFTDPTNTCPTHSGPLVEERSDEAAESSAPKEPEIINFTAGMVCPVEKCPSRQKRAYQREGEFAMHWTRMHKPSRHYACTRCKHTIKYMEGMLDTNAENNAACYHYKTEHKTHGAHWKKGYKLEYCPMVDPGHLRY